MKWKIPVYETPGAEAKWIIVDSPSVPALLVAIGARPVEESVQSDDNVFCGLDRWERLVTYLADHEVNALEIRLDSDDVEIKNGVLYVPQHLESVTKELLQSRRITRSD